MEDGGGVYLSISLGIHTPLPGALRDTVNKRAVCNLLECIFVEGKI